MNFLGRRLIVVFVVILAIVLSLPNFVPEGVRKHLPESLQPVSLGLDLRGGAYLLMDISMEQVENDRMQQLKGLVRQTLIGEQGQEKVRFESLRLREKSVTFTLRNPDQKDLSIKRLFKLGEDIDVSDSGKDFTVQYTDAGWVKIRKDVLEKSIEIVRRRIDALGMKEPSIQQQGERRLVIQLPGVDTPENVKALIGKTAKMTIHMVAEDVGCATTISYPYHNNPNQTVEVCREVELSGEYLADSRVIYDESGRPGVSTTFTGIGSRQFETLTGENIGKRFAIVLDGKVLSAPTIQGRIPGGNGQITGSFGVQEAKDLSMLLRSGALPAPLTVVEERSVGPGLGADSVRAGTIACLVGLLLVMIAMVLIYGFWGLIVDGILMLNILLLFGILSFFGATLTLPGIAGIVLTLGMAVDANVLIFDRMREEASNGLSALRAAQVAYDRAFITILDANVTTLVAAILLFQFGTGPIRGFAVTLALGVLTSMFTGVFVSRTIFEPKVYKTNKMPLFKKK
ncbi:MAG: protein translocase subunit SecD [Alphaproteobacteria bacterium]|nr:protein translocase subunit SecD [Alphaproteobacteria bacterium]